jgi:NAD(P)-dependent dehydrogenase (short-subunit alcohol dehydrogenase family)
MNLDFKGRVAIVTGAGGGLGRHYALALAGLGLSSSAAEKVVAEIQEAGGEAITNAASVTDFGAVQGMVRETMEKWGRVDVLVNNAGILRDRSFAKMDLDDFRLVMDVHLMGSVNCAKAVWEIMQQQGYGRIMMTTSSSGLYGNFGQSNYSAAKMALVGLMQTLAIEGQKYNIHVNSVAPTAFTRMTEGLMEGAAAEMLSPEAVVPAMLVLTHESAPTRTILCAGAGTFEAAHITMTEGVHIGTDADSPERLASALERVMNRDRSIVPEAGSVQGRNEVERAMAAFAR